MKMSFERIRPGLQMAKRIQEKLASSMDPSIHISIPEQPININATLQKPDLIVSKNEEMILILEIDIRSCGHNEDHAKKLRIYEEAGIAEHWLLFPSDGILVARKKDTFRKPSIYAEGETIQTSFSPPLSVSFLLGKE